MRSLYVRMPISHPPLAVMVVVGWVRRNWKRKGQVGWNWGEGGQARRIRGEAPGVEGQVREEKTSAAGTTAAPCGSIIPAVEGLVAAMKESVAAMERDLEGCPPRQSPLEAVLSSSDRAALAT